MEHKKIAGLINVTIIGRFSTYMHLSHQLSLRTARNMYTRNNQNIRIAHGTQHDYSKQSKHSKDALFAITNTLIFISDVFILSRALLL